MNIFTTGKLKIFSFRFAQVARGNGCAIFTDRTGELARIDKNTAYLLYPPTDC